MSPLRGCARERHREKDIEYVHVRERKQKKKCIQGSFSLGRQNNTLLYVSKGTQRNLLKLFSIIAWREKDTKGRERKRE